jgi:hypothetical protein
LIVFNRGSALYSLKYKNENPRYADVYRLRVEAGGQYQYNSVLISASGAFNASYQHLDDSLTSDGKLYECYFKYSPDVSFSLLAGKKTFRWGKGYAYNPVSFAGRPRDLNDIDAALEGYWNLSTEYIRSFSGRLSTIAITGAVLPVYGSLNKGFLRDRTLAGVTQLYFLFLDTDIDCYLLADSRNEYRAGVDFSTIQQHLGSTENVERAVRAADASIAALPPPDRCPRRRRARQMVTPPGSRRGRPLSCRSRR